MTDRRNLTFAQAEGAQPIPSQLALRTISQELSAALWAIVYASLSECIQRQYRSLGSPVLTNPWDGILASWWVTVEHRNIDEFPPAESMFLHVKEIVTSRNYIRVFEFIQFVIRDQNAPLGFPEFISDVLENCRAAYRVVDKTIIPIGSDEEAMAIESAIEAARNASAQGPRTHLRNAMEALSAGEWAETIRESIHAVEAAAKSIEPTASTLGPALTNLQKSISLNPAMSKAFQALYGYSSDEKGIRHALVFEDAANVGERDALFMFGSCAAFVSYLLNSAKEI